MSYIDIEQATIRLYEDISLTDELTDEPAKVLLQWGAGQLRALAEKHSDEEAFEADFKQLRRLMKSINRFTGRRREMTVDEQREYARRIFDTAYELGYYAPYSQVAVYVDQQRYLAPEDNIRMLTRLVETGTPDIPLV